MTAYNICAALALIFFVIGVTLLTIRYGSIVDRSDPLIDRAISATFLMFLASLLVVLVIDWISVP
jgi:SNF family Na+-dependent transporter